MSEQLTYVIKETLAESISIGLIGFVDESTREVLFKLKGQLPPVKKIFINCSEIKRINSIGISHYSRFVSEMSEVSIEYVACSVVFMDFVGMLPVIFEKARIISFFAEFYCEPCDKETQVLVNHDHAMDITRTVCPHCGEEAMPMGYLEDIQNVS